jgi:hypothetical protein
VVAASFSTKVYEDAAARGHGHATISSKACVC